MNRRRFAAAAAGAVSLPFLGCDGDARRPLTNCSYDATRDLYRRVNRLFADRFAADHPGAGARVSQSHGGSGSQARAVIDGLPADVITLALWPDTDAVRKKGLLRDGWEDRYPSRSCPYTSTIVFVVRRGNPFGITDWADLADGRPGRDTLQIVTANPKTSGAAKLGAVACWGSVTTAGGSTADATERVRAVYRKAPGLESSSRAATTTFARKRIGDVHLTWENEAWLEVREARGDLAIVYPSRSISAEPHVAVVDANADRNGTADLADAYLRFLYDPAAQAVMADNFLRPTTPVGAALYAATLGRTAGPDVAERAARMALFTAAEAVRSVAGVRDGWDAAGTVLFADGGVFDRSR